MSDKPWVRLYCGNYQNFDDPIGPIIQGAEFAMTGLTLPNYSEMRDLRYDIAWDEPHQAFFVNVSAEFR